MFSIEKFHGFELELLKQIFENTEKIFFVYGLEENQFIALSASFYNVFAGKVEMFRENPLSLVHADDQEIVKNHFNRLLSDAKTQDVEFRVLLPKREKYFCVSAHAIENKEGKKILIAGLAEDINNRKLNEASIFNINSRKNATLEILSHDLTGPLTNIKLLSSIIKEECEKQNFKDMEHYTVLIQEACQNSINLIADFINSEFLESSNVDLATKRVNIVERLQSLIENYQQSEKKILKNFHLIADNPIIYLNIDDMKFMQVINNLISNAIKFTHDNGNIWVKVKENKDSVKIEIADDGVGIPQKFHDKLFEKFTKARRPGLKGEKSIGLGLSLVKKIIEMHHGAISFKSEENFGTTFYIEIPNKGES